MSRSVPDATAGFGSARGGDDDTAFFTLCREKVKKAAKIVSVH